jgi:hypothetical protein
MTQFVGGMVLELKDRGGEVPLEWKVAREG